MPPISKRGCGYPGCPALVLRGYCPEHQAKSTRSMSRKRFDQLRGSSSQRGYDRDWQRLRCVVLREEPVCRTCQRALAQEVDHIVPIDQAPERRLDRSNLQALCKSCHSRKTAVKDSAFASGHFSR